MRAVKDRLATHLLKQVGRLKDRLGGLLVSGALGARGFRREMSGLAGGLLYSCNARSKKTLVGHAQWETP